MPITASQPTISTGNPSWAEWVDRAITEIVKDHVNDPVWDWSYSPTEGYDSLSDVIGWPRYNPSTNRLPLLGELTEDEGARAMQMHRRAQKNRLYTQGRPGRPGYRPLWVQYYHSRTKMWRITAYRGTGGLTRLKRRNAATMLFHLVQEMVTRFKSDITLEFLPTIEQYPAYEQHFQRCLTNSILQRLEHATADVELDTQSVMRLFRGAEAREIKVDIASCMTMHDLIMAFSDALATRATENGEVD